MRISLIVVADENNGIGINNNLLCHLPADLKYFKRISTGHHILMGRKTFDAVGKALPNRTNIIISKSGFKADNTFSFDNIKSGIEFANQNGEEELFIVGGDSIYAQSIELADKIYLTRIHYKFEADSYFPKLDDKWNLESSQAFKADDKNAYDYTFLVYTRK